MNNKKIIILSAALIIAVVAGTAVWFWLGKGTSPAQPSRPGGSLHAPEFMTEAEKQQFQLAPSSRVQVISRDGEGQVSVYKVIRSEADIVADPSQLPALSPRLQEAATGTPAAE